MQTCSNIWLWCKPNLQHLVALRLVGCDWLGWPTLPLGWRDVHPSLGFHYDEAFYVEPGLFNFYAKPLAQIMWILLTITGHVLFHFLTLWWLRLTDLLSIVVLTEFTNLLYSCSATYKPNQLIVGDFNWGSTYDKLLPADRYMAKPNLCKLLMLEHRPPALLPLQVLTKFQLHRCQVYLHTSRSPTRCICQAKNNSSLKHRGCAGVKLLNGLPNVFLKLS